LQLTLDRVKVHQRLVLCNAYAYPKPLDVYLVHSGKKITDRAPLAYKECSDFNVLLEDGEEIEFRAGSLAIGSFYLTKLPQSSTSLLLIPHRRSSQSLSATFDSHAFNELHSAQIAIVDAYRGQERARVRIMDRQTHSQPEDKRIEELRFNSVIVLQPGKYEISLEGDTTNVTTVPLEVSNQTVNVVMRVGNDDGVRKGVNFFPPDLIAFAPRRQIAPVPIEFTQFTQSEPRLGLQSGTLTSRARLASFLGVGLFLADLVF
jgi:hypothetical protein